jgi:hypothetical protein
MTCHLHSVVTVHIHIHTKSEVFLSISALPQSDAFYQDKLSVLPKYDACSILAERVVHFCPISAKMQLFNCSFHQAGFARKENQIIILTSAFILTNILANRHLFVDNLAKITSDDI